MKILFVFTGGTIGSAVQDDHISLDAACTYELLEGYRERYGMPFEFDTVSPYSLLSEYSDGRVIGGLVRFIGRYIEQDYDGIVVMHGTDTLQYSAAALGYAFSGTRVPICLVSAAYPLSDARSNGFDNLHGAICFIRTAQRGGVYVSYRNSGEAVAIHRATRLLASEAFSDRVASLGGEVGHFDAAWNFCANAAYAEREDALDPIGAIKLPATCEGVLRLQVYPGMRYPALDGVRYVLLEGYHSGTLNTADPCGHRFFAQARERGIPVFLAGATPGIGYASELAFDSLGIRPICNISPVALFVKLWMLDAAHPERRVNANELERSLGGDVFGGGEPPQKELPLTLRFLPES